MQPIGHIFQKTNGELPTIAIATCALLIRRQVGWCCCHNLWFKGCHFTPCTKNTHDVAVTAAHCCVHRGHQLPGFHCVDFNFQRASWRRCKIMSSHCERVATPRMLLHRSAHHGEQIAPVGISHDVPAIKNFGRKGGEAIFLRNWCHSRCSIEAESHGQHRIARILMLWRDFL